MQSHAVNSVRKQTEQGAGLDYEAPRFPSPLIPSPSTFFSKAPPCKGAANTSDSAINWRTSDDAQELGWSISHPNHTGFVIILPS